MFCPPFLGVALTGVPVEGGWCKSSPIGHPQQQRTRQWATRGSRCAKEAQGRGVAYLQLESLNLAQHPKRIPLGCWGWQIADPCCPRAVENLHATLQPRNTPNHYWVALLPFVPLSMSYISPVRCRRASIMCVCDR